MSHLRYYTYGVYGESAAEKFHYSQSVQIGDSIHCSGQGGWSPDSKGTSPEDIPDDLDAEITQAFDNVDRAIQAAGGQGWSNVYKFTSYHVALNHDALEVMVRELKKRCPAHKPLWTCIGVAKLAFDHMRVEIDVSAQKSSQGMTLTP